MISRAGALGAVTALGMLGPIAIGAASAAGADAGDMKLLEGAVELERAAIQAYTASASLLSPPVAAVATQFSADHNAQLAALTQLMQQNNATVGTDTATLTINPPKTEADVLANALAFEKQLASYYLAAIPQFKNRDLAKTAASILGVDATHVALLAEALRQSPAYPGGFLA
jgi:rubrerythrin